MRPIGELLAQLTEDLPLGADVLGFGDGLRVTEVDVEVPIEARLRADGLVEASLPRGRLATGFQVPHSRLRARLESREP